MTNHRLRGAMSASGYTNHRMAEQLSVDTKTVERWLTQDRLPHPTTRAKIAMLLGHDETYLWPSLLTGHRAAAASISEFVQMWPSRADVPHDVWRTLMNEASETIEVLVYSGGFLVESLNFAQVVAEKARAGCSVRILLGDPNSENVRARAREEGLPALPQRCRSTAEYLAPNLELAAVSMRIHDTPLYNSIYRFDGSMLVNTHAYGVYAAKAPVQHLQHIPGGRLFSFYTESFEHVWSSGRPVV